MIRNINSLMDRMNRTTPEEAMSLLMGNYVGPSIIVPEPDKYYVFVYVAKTPGIVYDQHPFIQCLNTYRWGFTGENFHMGSRQYSWAEVRSNLLEIEDNEVELVQQMPLARIKS